MKDKDNRRRGRRGGLKCTVESRGSKTQRVRRDLVGPRRKARETEFAVLICPGDPPLVGRRVLYADGGTGNRDLAIRLNNTRNRDRRLRCGILLRSHGGCDGE